MSAMDDPVAKMMGSIFASGTGKKIFFGVFQKDVELSEAVLPSRKNPVLGTHYAANEVTAQKNR